MIPVAAEKDPKPCTVAGCRCEAVIWCPKCGEARCERHRKDLPTRSCCVLEVERRP